MQLTGKVAVVTGASSGIGRALAVELGLHGAKVGIAARSALRLAETASLLRAYGIDHVVIPFDVTSAASRHALLEQIQRTYSKLDIFINNAGIGLFEDICQSTPQDVDAVLQTNLLGPLAMMQAVAPLLDGGLLVNVSSAAAKYAPYRQGIYAASKAALERITESLGIEEASHLRTLLVIPDRTETPFMGNVVGPREHTKLALNLKAASAETVARAAVAAIVKNRSICYTTTKSRVYALLSALFPGVVRRIIEKTK